MWELAIIEARARKQWRFLLGLAENAPASGVSEKGRGEPTSCGALIVPSTVTPVSARVTIHGPVIPNRVVARTANFGPIAITTFCFRLAKVARDRAISSVMQETRWRNSAASAIHS